MIIKYTGKQPINVTVSNIAQDTTACAFWKTGSVPPKGHSYIINGIYDDNDNTTSIDFSYNTVLKDKVTENPTSTSLVFKTAENIYDEKNGRYPTYVWSYISFIPHFHDPDISGNSISSTFFEVRQRQNSISVLGNSSRTLFWNIENENTASIGPIKSLPQNSYTSYIKVTSTNKNVAYTTQSQVLSNNNITVTAKSKGTATIHFSPYDEQGGSTSSVTIESKTGVKKLTLSYNTIVNYGGKTYISVTKTPIDADSTKCMIYHISGSGCFSTGNMEVNNEPFSRSGYMLYGNNAYIIAGQDIKFLVQSDDAMASEYVNVNVATPKITITTPPTYHYVDSIFTYSLSGHVGDGVWSYTNCSYIEDGKMLISATNPTITWSPSDEGFPVSKTCNTYSYYEYGRTLRYSLNATSIEPTKHNIDNHNNQKFAYISFTVVNRSGENIKITTSDYYNLPLYSNVTGTAVSELNLNQDYGTVYFVPYNDDAKITFSVNSSKTISGSTIYSFTAINTSFDKLNTNISYYNTYYTSEMFVDANGFEYLDEINF